MRFTIFKVIFLFVSGIAVAAAQEVIGPPIELHVEEPAYTGMPVWLDVDVQDGCLEAVYGGDGGGAVFGGRGDRAEIRHDNRPARRPAHVTIRDSDNGPVSGAACPGSRPTQPPSAHRFPLHLGASFDEPGHCKVRWVIPNHSHGPPALARSDWVDFNVFLSTPAQREAWLTNLLAHPPQDLTSMVRDYIPSLLAAPQDGRVRRALFSLICSDNPGAGFAAVEVLPWRLDADMTEAFTKMVEGGCLTPPMATLLSLHQQDFASDRLRLLHTVLNRVQGGTGAQLAAALAAIEWLRRKDPHDASRGFTDQILLAAAPGILAGSDEAAKDAWAAVAWNTPPSPQVVNLFRRLAIQPGTAADRALGCLSANADPVDLPLFVSLLTKPLPPGMRADRYEDVPQALGHDYGAKAIPALRQIMQHSPGWGTRDNAAIACAELGDAAGMRAVIAALRNADSAEPTYVLSDIQDVPIPHAENGPAAAIAYFQAKLKHAH